MMKRCLILVFVLCLLVGCGGEPKAGDTRVRKADGMVIVYVPSGAHWAHAYDPKLRPVRASTKNSRFYQ